MKNNFIFLSEHRKQFVNQDTNFQKENKNHINKMNNTERKQIINPAVATPVFLF
jgi:hypothetical protein